MGFQMQDGLREPDPSHGFVSQPLSSPSGCLRVSTHRHRHTHRRVHSAALLSHARSDSVWWKQLAHREEAGDDGSCRQVPEHGKGDGAVP